MEKEITNLALQRELRQIPSTHKLLIEGRVVSSNVSCTSFRICFSIFGNTRTRSFHRFHYNPGLKLYWRNVVCKIVENKGGTKSEVKTSVTLYWRAQDNLEPYHI